MKIKTVYLLMIYISILTGIYLSFLTDEGVPTKPQETELSGALEALNFWTRSRAYPMEDIPSGKYFYEYNLSKANLSKTSQSLDNTTSWKTMGPFNITGRMISLAVNPNNPSTLYAGSASGGLWRTFSSETGNNWHRVPTGFPVLGVMAIAIDPVDTNTIYIGTGEVYGYKSSTGGTVIRTTRGSYGIGILKTTDGGETWLKSLDWTYNEEKGVQCIRINPQNSNTIYAATTEGIYKSTNAGESWVNILPVLMGEDIVINTSDTNKVMVSCGNLGSEGSGLYRSLDAGKSWTKLDGIPAYDGKTLLEMFASNPDIIFASVANALVFDSDEEGLGLWRTDDFGANWTSLHTKNVPRYQGWYSHWVAVHPTDLNQIIHAGVSAYKSNDGGNSLENIFMGGCDYHNYVHHPSDPNVLYLAFDQGVSRVNGFGESCEKIDYGLQTAQFYNGFSSSASDSNFALGGLQDNKTIIFSGTKDWYRVARGDGCWTAVNPWDDDIVYASSSGNKIYKSVNHAQSFYNITNGLYGDAAFVAPYVLCPSNPSILYSGRKKVFKTIDGGTSWFTPNDEELDGNKILSMAVSSTNSDVVYVGTAPSETRAHIFKTSNGGDTWTDITSTLPDRYPMDLAVDPDDDQTVYAIFSGFGSPHVFKSTNGGASWININGALPDIPTLSIAIDPLNSNHIYVGNDIGVYISQDGGSSWNTFNTGLPDAVIAMDLSISPANRQLRVATHGSGAYQRPLLYKPAVYLNFSFSSVPEINLLGSEFAFDGSASNIGSETFSEIYTIKLRVVDNETNNEYYQSSTEIGSLGPGESQAFTFDGTFTPQDTGRYIIEYIKLGTNQHPVQDTVRQFIRIINLPSIARVTVTKEYRPYAEIQGSESSASGDEETEIISLPFEVNFDGFDYDQMQISTNGWSEFGTGPMDSERGLTSSEILYLFSYNNESLASPGHPSKIVAPWWDDLNTGNEGVISYETIGSEPYRVFIVQWKNMRAYWSNETSTLINFQLRIYETTNIIEYHYGTVVEGTFSGDKIGASIGLKDHLGGDFHFYDVIAGGTSRFSDLITSLSPLTDWPGPDSCIVIQPASLKETVWQTQSSGTENKLYETKAVSELTAWAVGKNGTVLRTINGGNLWNDVWDQPDNLNIYTVEGLNENVALIAGETGDWQAGTNITYIYRTSDGGNSWMKVFEQPHGWMNNITMFNQSEGVAIGDPVNNVWTILKTSDGGNTWEQIANAPSAEEGEWGNTYSVLWLNDSTGWFGSNKSKALHTIDGGKTWSSVDIPSYTSKMTLAINQTGIGLASSAEALLRTTDNGNSWQEISPPDSGKINYLLAHKNIFWLLSDNTIYKSLDLGLSWNLETSAEANLFHLSLFPKEDELFGWAVGENGSILHYTERKITDIKTAVISPKKFILWQNYPNPFNPTTTIRYELPIRGQVVLKIYNIIGQKVKTLVDKVQTSGKKLIVWDGRDDFGNIVSSGVYIYKIQAGTEFKAKKMVFLK